jgi:uncharacterized protein YhbP (UPF0306 family)
MPDDAMTQPILSVLRIADAAGLPIPTSKVTNRQIQRSIYQILDDNVLCSIASITPDGIAHINTAYFAYTPDLKIYFLSHPNALHCKNILINPSMALAIFSSNQTWGSPDRGLQLFGLCKQVIEREAGKADRLYGKRFAKYSAWKANFTSDSTGRDYRFYRFITSELKVFDEKELGAGIFVMAKVKGTATND